MFHARYRIGPTLGLVASALLAGGGCSGAGATKPTAILSGSIETEAVFRGIAGDWGRLSLPARDGLRPRLEVFRQQFPKDDLRHTAELYLAWIELDRGNYQAAAERARKLEVMVGAGVTADLAATCEGAALRRMGLTGPALVILSPLVSKLIDGWARSVFNAEIVEAAVAEGQWGRALELMSVWLREAGPDERETVRAHVLVLLPGVPDDQLLAILEGRAKDNRAAMAELADLAEEELELRKLVALRLAKQARERRDPDLAARLLQSSGALLGDEGEAIAAIASGVSKARVEVRTVGLLLSLRDDRSRRRLAEVAAGVAFGLGLPASSAKLVSRDDGGKPAQITAALSALTGDGANLLIAGSDREEATISAKFAEDHRIPVLLLRPPLEGFDFTQARFTFVVGPKGVDLEAALAAGLKARKADPVTLLANEAPSVAQAETLRVALPDVPLQLCDTWKPGGSAGFVLRGEPSCAVDFLRGKGLGKVRFAANLDFLASALPKGSLVPTLGLFPLLDGPTPAPLDEWMKSHRTPPTFWSALGRDAAMLGWQSVQVLPKRGTADPKEVEAQHAQVASALRAAKGELWTTEAHGFAGGQVLGRTLGIRELDGHERAPD